MNTNENRMLNQINGSVFDAAKATTAQDYTQGRLNVVGDCVRFNDGRVFRYAKAGGTVTIGDLVVAVPTEQDIAATYFGADSSTAPITGEGEAAGDTIIRLTDDVSGVTLNEYAGGYLLITDAAGEGQCRRIKTNQATGSAGTGFTVTLYDGLTTALTNASVGTMVKNIYDGVVVHTAANYGGTATQMCVGGAVVAATVGQFFWVQTWGLGIAQAGAGAFIQGAPIQLAEDVDGSGQVPVATENRVQVIGTALEATADTVWGPVLFQIMP